MPIGTPETLSPAHATRDRKIPMVATLVIDRHMWVISILVSKNINNDILIDGGSEVNVIIVDEYKRLALFKLSQALFNLKMENGMISKLKGLISNVKT